MNKISEYKIGQQYSDEVRNAVRYGYRYRKEAERLNNNLLVHACLNEEPDVLLWLANLVVCGVAWDAIKEIVKRLYKIVNKDGKSPLNLLDVDFSDEECLREFYNDVKEFNEQCMSVTNEQFKYIREEIIADYYGKECAKIFNNFNRLPTIEEYKRINNEANTHADMLLGQRNK